MWGKFENDSIPTTEPGGLFTSSAIPGGAVTNTNSPGRGIVVHSVNSIRPDLLNDAAFNFSQSAIHATPVGLTAKANSPDISVPEPYANTQGVVPTLQFHRRIEHHWLRSLQRVQQEFQFLRRTDLDPRSPYHPGGPLREPL